MDFGRLDDISGVDFRLPPDPAVTGNTLSALATSDDDRSPRAYIGCPVWARRDWVGVLYPPGTKARDYLRAYGRQFNTIELNSSHYHVPLPETVERWVEAAPDDFRFAPKVPQAVSHAEIPDLKTLDLFCDTIRGMGRHLGPAFLQLPPDFGLRNRRWLARLLDRVPLEIPLAIELRNPAWFHDQGTYERLCAHLAQQRRTLVITDVAGRRDLLHTTVTAPFAFVRFVGNSLHPTDFTRLDEWAERLAGWFQQGLRELYFFVHQPNEVDGAPLVRHLVQHLNERCDLKLRTCRSFEAPEQVQLF